MRWRWVILIDESFLLREEAFGSFGGSLVHSQFIYSYILTLALGCKKSLVYKRVGRCVRSLAHCSGLNNVHMVFIPRDNIFH
jgi:hypothetical protein